MKIDNYITHLELRRKGLRAKYNSLQSASLTYFKNGYTYSTRNKKLDPNYDEMNKIKKEIREINSKLVFLLKLKKGVINESNRVQENTKRTRF